MMRTAVRFWSKTGCTTRFLSVALRVPVRSRPFASIPSGTRIEQAVSSTQLRELNVTWNDGTTHAFPNVWLRDQCWCPKCRNPTTEQNLVDSASIPLDIAFTDVALSDAGKLKITWMNDNHQSVYDGDWLRECVEKKARLERLRRALKGPRLWRALRVDSLPTARYDSVMKSDVDLYKWMLGLQDYGFAIVKGVPPVKDTLRLFAERIAYVKETIFGQLFDVIAEPEDVASHFAYTSQALDLHTDLNYREKSPGFQMLHCLESKGPPDQGTSHFADGFAAAGWLRENHPSAFHILTSLPVNFTLRTYGRKYCYHVPIICTDPCGNVEEIHVNNDTLNTSDIPRDSIVPFFASYKTFVAKLRDGSVDVRFKLEEGDLVTFCNRRILHGRTGYDPKKTRRYLQGCYLDYDEVTSKLDSLRDIYSS
ncbi:gamma-butyrobetaine dioxygenase-like [Oscarella lobularis]|uniref:gamma-butyrobetaine dioxygenase-like n=1 Tax=Oscarella lobularis TaxID=121494 RepID=UPI0033137D20